MVNHVLRTLAEVATLDESVVYASSDDIMSYVEVEPAPRFVQRPEWLDGDDAKVQDFVGGFLAQVDCDVVALLHITSPFISTSSVEACVDAVVSGGHSSAFAAIELRKFCWFEGKPLNYAIDRPTPRTQDLEPVIVEQSGLYVFTRELFEATGSRIGPDPYIHIVDTIEGHDIDTPEEFEMAEMIARSRMSEEDR